MSAVIRAYGLAFDSMRDRRIRGLFWISVAVTLVILVAFAGLIWWAVEPLQGLSDRIPGWLVESVAWGGGGVLAWLVLPSILMAVQMQFMDDIAAVVEKRDYPFEPAGHAVGWGQSLAIGLRLMALTGLINLLVLPLYIAVFWFPVLNLVLVYGVNGYCLSRALVDQIGLRYVRQRELKELRRAGGSSILLCGMVAAVVLSIPVLNLIGPILVTVASVHVVRAALRARGTLP